MPNKRLRKEIIIGGIFMALSLFSIFNAFGGEQNQEKSFWAWFQKN